MGISLVVAITDYDWFNMLRQQPQLTEINFWAPSGTVFRALQPGELFLFKLHAPYDVIVGGGVFAYSTTLPCSLAWEAFKEANGASSAKEMRARIAKYRRAEPNDRSDFEVGCRILTQPFFFEQNDWFSPPPSWSRNIVSFKTYSTDDPDGVTLWKAVNDHLARPALFAAETTHRFGEPQLIRPRLGQGAFRIVVTDVYERRCAVTQERTLPALEAAHIKPYSEGGTHDARNGILLRRDIHSLFDAGYVTVTPELRFEVSRRIREEFENGRHCYSLHGQQVNVPRQPSQQPDSAALRWHNNSCFRG
jgi:putative restriction endonuclease